MVRYIFSAFLSTRIVITIAIAIPVAISPIVIYYGAGRPYFYKRPLKKNSFFFTDQ
jgi:hypothetical protein